MTKVCRYYGPQQVLDLVTFCKMGSYWHLSASFYCRQTKPGIRSRCLKKTHCTNYAAQSHKGSIFMHKTIRNLIFAATILTGFAGTSYATSMSNSPQPYPPGVPRG